MPKLISNLEANRNLEGYSKSLAFKSVSTDNEKERFKKEALNQLTEDEDTIFLGMSPVTRKIKLFHSVTNLGGTGVRKDNKIVALEGFGPTATPVLLNEAGILAPLEVKVPTYSQLKAISRPEQVPGCSPTASGWTYLKNAQLIILPPFIANAFVEITERDPSKMIIETNSLINFFDSKPDSVESNKAANHCKYILSFLWAAAHSHIPPTYLMPDADDTELQTWSSNRHNNCLLPLVPPGLPPPAASSEMMQSLALSIKQASKVMEKFREDKLTETIKKDKFLNLHESAQRMILNASSISGETSPEKPSQSCSKFFSKSSVSQAKEFLSTSLEEDYGCCVELQDGFVSALFAGHFTRDRADIPSNFSLFLVPKKSPLTYDHRRSNLILQLKLKHGKTLESGEMKDLVKQGIICPNSIDLLVHQLQNIWGASCFFFGNNSILARRIMPTIQSITENVLTFEHSQI